MVNIRPLSAALTKRAREELNEKPEEIEARINELKEWILTQPHLKARTGTEIREMECSDLVWELYVLFA